MAAWQQGWYNCGTLRNKFPNLSAQFNLSLSSVVVAVQGRKIVKPYLYFKWHGSRLMTTMGGRKVMRCAGWIHDDGDGATRSSR